MTSPCHRTRVEGRRFGLLADTHDNAVDWPAALGRIRAALGQVDAILHCGDLCTEQALTTLAETAPLYAVRSAADIAAVPPALVDGTRLLDIGGLKIGVVASLTREPVGANTDEHLRFAGLPAVRVGPALFGGPVDVCVFGGTHKPAVASAAGTMFVNPGSPTLSKTPSVAILTVDHGTASVEIIPVA